MRILTGIQPTNNLHIGNLFGALIPATKLQEEHELFMMVADYHAITTLKDPKRLTENTLFTAAAYLAAGIDPARTTLFVQSSVNAHTELAWILQTIARMGEANRMTQFKDKAQNGAEKAPVGLFTYPVLMAADILLYGTEGVPVGADQKQHVELTRDLAERFNRDFGDTFVVPEPMIGTSGARIKSLTEPEKKMSKSAASAKSYILLTDEEDMIAKKIRSAVTDSEREITLDDERKGLLNLITIFSLCTEYTKEEVAERYQHSGMKVFKDDLVMALNQYLAPIRMKMQEYGDDRAGLLEVLQTGNEAAETVANGYLKTARERIGLLRA